MIKLFALLVGGFIAVPSAQSAVITYDFTATVSSMFEYDGVTQRTNNVAGSIMSGRQMATGNTVHGRLIYDTGTALSPYYQPEQPAGGSYLVYGGAGANELELTFDHDGYQFQSDRTFQNSHFQVANRQPGEGFDVFYVSMDSGWNPSTFESTTLSLMDHTGTAFTVSTMPESLDLAAFRYASIDYAWLRKSDGSQVHAVATLTSLDMVVAAAVPEPSSAALICLGLVAIGSAGIHRRASRLAA